MITGAPRDRIQDLTIRYFKAFEDVQVRDLGRLNAFVGRNNAGKSSVLHALDLMGLAIRWNDWSRFFLKLKVEDLFWDRGDCSLAFTTAQGMAATVTTQNRQSPQVTFGGAKREDFDTILILPDQGQSSALLSRRPIAPLDVFNALTNRDYNSVNALDILQAVYFYASREQRGFVRSDYDDLVRQVRDFFPELEEIRSDRTEQLYATLEYKEYGRLLDILYAGTGLKRFLDVLIKVTLSKAPIVLLDEPEVGMHPELQRRFVGFLAQLAETKELQVFMATHSPIFLNASTEVEVYRVANTNGKRAVTRVPENLRHTSLGDLGVRPSDLYQNDICLMVEGQDDVVFFEYVVHELYKNEFAGLAVAVCQYAGSAASGIVTGDLDVTNVSAVQRYVHWIRDRDAQPKSAPAADATAFVKAILKAGQSATLLAKREIEFYVPEAVYVDAQKGNPKKEAAVRAILRGDQSTKLRKAFAAADCNVARGSHLRNGLKKHLTRTTLDNELRDVIEGVLVPWAKEIRGT